eukprot:7081674-Pyramimonas_sp.AAC.1
MHRDGTLLTVNIALNDRVEYQGGGTVFAALTTEDANAANADEDAGGGSGGGGGGGGGGGAIRLRRGHALLHPGEVLHGGQAITSGVRYVLVLFLMDTTAVEHALSLIHI